jgi:hypothetical protein
MPPANAVADAANANRPTSVETNISDLFFNRDLESCRVLDERGRFDGWDYDKLTEEAASTLNCLSGLGVPVPDVAALVEDFLARC